MSDTLMTVCSYDDPADARRALEQLKAAGIEANLKPCLYEDPEYPDTKFTDLVIFDKDLEAAQAALDIFPPDPTEILDPVGFDRAQTRTRTILWVMAVLAMALILVSFVL